MKFESNCEIFRNNLHNLWQADKYCDVLIISTDGETRILAHRLVLEASSPYFASQIANAIGSMKEIVVPSIDGITLQRLVGACYSGSLEVDEDDVSRLYTHAVHLQLNSLLNTMDNYIVAQLKNSNCLYFYHLAESLSRSELFEATKHYICEHFNEISDEPLFLELEGEKLKNLMASEDLIVPSAEDLFRNVIKWIQHALEGQRDDVFSELLPNLRLSSMSAEFLLTQVKPHCKTVETKEIVFAAIETQLDSILPELETQLDSTLSVSTDAVNLPVSDDIRRDQLVIVAECAGKTNILQYCFEQQEWIILVEIPNFNNFSVIYSKALNSLCFVGGYVNRSRGKDVLLWNLQTRIFTNLACMQRSRCSPGVVSIDNGNDADGDLIVIGGENNYNETIEYWSRKSGNWHSLCKIDLNIRNCISCIRAGRSVNTTYFIIGIYARHTERTNSAYRMHGIIEIIPQNNRTTFGTFTDEGKLYLIGGGTDVIECTKGFEWGNGFTQVYTVEGSAAVTTCVRHNNRFVAFGENIVLTSDGDFRVWKRSDTIKSPNGTIYGAFSLPLK